MIRFQSIFKNKISNNFTLFAHQETEIFQFWILEKDGKYYCQYGFGDAPFTFEPEIMSISEALELIVENCEDEDAYYFNLFMEQDLNTEKE